MGVIAALSCEQILQWIKAHEIKYLFTQVEKQLLCYCKYPIVKVGEGFIADEMLTHKLGNTLTQFVIYPWLLGLDYKS